MTATAAPRRDPARDAAREPARARVAPAAPASASTSAPGSGSAGGAIFADPKASTSAGAWFARQAGWTPRSQALLPPPLPYVPSLDGLRGLAVAAVLLFHSGVALTGGFLGVSTFFTLSGFLITSVLLTRAEGSRGIAPGSATGDRLQLRTFWSRRFRRLLPAALLAIVLAAVFVARAGDASQARAFRADGLAALLDVANWHFIVEGTSYASTSASPSPLLHFWSLAIEEQFYLVFPLVAWGVLRLVRGSRKHFGLVIGALLLASASVPRLFDLSNDRVYFGTDTRAAELLAGALLAVVLAGRGCSIDRIDRRWSRRTWSACALVGMAAFEVMLLLWWFTSRATTWVYGGGLPIYAGLTVLVLVAALTPGNPVRRILSVRPLRWLGLISYGVYVYHWPIFLWLSPANTGWEPWTRLVVGTALTLAVAVLSYVFLERPILERRPPPLPVRKPTVERRASGSGVFTRVMPAAALGVAVLVVAVSTGAPAPAGDVTLDAAPGSFVSAQPATTVDPDLPIDTAVPVPEDEAADGAIPAASSATIGLSPSTTLLTGRPIAATAPPTAPPAVPAPTTAPAPVAAGPLPAKPVRRPTRPLRVVVVGDSTAGFLDPGLAEWGDQNHIFSTLNFARIGCGIGRGGQRINHLAPEWIPAECGSWAADWAKMLREQQPDIVMIASNFWDATDRKLLGDDAWRSPGDPVYDAYISEEYAQAVELLGSTGAVVAFVDNPPIQLGLNDPQGTSDYAVNDVARQDRMNELLAQIATTHPSMRVVPLSQFFRRWPGGTFDRRLRLDGLHVDGEGRQIVGAWLGPELLDAYWSVKAPT